MMRKRSRLVFMMMALPLLLASKCDPKEMSGDQVSNAMRDSMANESEDTRNKFSHASRGYRTFPDVGGVVDSYVSPPRANCAHQAFERFDASTPSRLRARPHKGGPAYYETSLRNHPRPWRGCIPVENITLDDARKAIASQNLSFESPSEGAKRVQQKKAFGAAIIRIQQLNGGPLKEGLWPGPKPYPIRCKHGVKTSGQRADHIQIKMSRSTSVAQYAHEYAHLIGNYQDRSVYKAYRKHMGDSGFCMASAYSDNNPSREAFKKHNEEFAEAFTAFVTEPSILLNNPQTPKACKKAFDFFKNKFFRNGSRVNECL